MAWRSHQRRKEESERERESTDLTHACIHTRPGGGMADAEGERGERGGRRERERREEREGHQRDVLGERWKEAS